MENMVRDDRNNKTINYRRKILPLISFGILVLVLSQQVVLYCPSVQAAHLDQEAKLNINERQRELIEHMSEKRKKSKKVKSKKSTSSAKTSSHKRASKPVEKPQPQPQPEVARPPPPQQQVVQQPVQQETRQEQQQVEIQQPQQIQIQQQQQPSPVQQQQVQETADVQSDAQQTAQQQLQSNTEATTEVDVSQQLTQQQQVAIEAFTTAATQSDSIMIENDENEKRFKPKIQETFTPSQQRQHRSPLQLPDITPTGEILPSDNMNVDEIAKASPEDAFAYSQVVALDDEAQAAFLKQMEPKPVNAEEDNGGMAQFMLDVGQQSQTLQQDKKEQQEQQEEQASEPEMTGADFAAQLSQKYEAQQKQREAGMGVAEKIATSYWFQNNNHQAETIKQPAKEQVSDEPDQQEAIEIDY